MIGLRLSPALRFAPVSITSIAGVLFGSLFMSVTGGGLQPYESRVAGAALRWVVGDAEAAAVLLEEPPATIPSWSAVGDATPALTPLNLTEADLLGGPLLGGPDSELPDAPRLRAPSLTLNIADMRAAAPLEIAPVTARCTPPETCELDAPAAQTRGAAVRSKLAKPV